MKKTILSLLIAVALIGSVSGQVIFQDNFTGYTVNTNNWNLLLPYASSQVTQNDGSIVLTDRGTITSVQSFGSALTISGTFTFNSYYDYLTVTTRTSGNIVSGNLNNQLEGYAFEFNSLYVNAENGGSTLGVKIDQQNDGFKVADADCNFDIGVPYIFSITDGGSYATVSINGVQILNTTLNPLFYPGNQIAVQNREFWAGDNSTTLGPIYISAVPEPSTYALFGIGAIGIMIVLRRKKTS